MRDVNGTMLQKKIGILHKFTHKAPKGKATVDAQNIPPKVPLNVLRVSECP